jgi:hypothetical protein
MGCVGSLRLDRSDPDWSIGTAVLVGVDAALPRWKLRGVPAPEQTLEALIRDKLLNGSGLSTQKERRWTRSVV